MKKITLLLLFISLQIAYLKAQANMPPVYQIKSDTLFRMDLDNSYWQILGDKESKWNIGQVQQPPLVNQFLNITKFKHGTFSPKTNWIRFSLKNATDTIIKLSLFLESVKSEVYIPGTNKILRRYITGHLIPWEKKDGFKKDNSIPFQMKPGVEMVIYLRAFNHKFPFSEKSTISLYNTGQLQRSIFKNYEENYIESSGFYYTIISGMLLLAAIFNFLIFLAMKEKVYLYFSLMLFFFAVNNAEPLPEILHNYPVWAVLVSVFGVVGLVFLLHFIRYYFHVFRYYPRWDKVLLIISQLLLLYILLRTFSDLTGYFINFFYNIIAVSIAVTIMALLIVSLLITVGIFLLKRSPERKIFIIAVLPYLICFVGSLISYFIYYSSNVSGDITGYLTGTSIVWSSVVFSMFLFKRYALQEEQIIQAELEKEQLEREKEIQKNEMIQKQKAELEKQVAERTFDLNHSIEELKAAQSQLIQSEKMASLGELTAGIAHEIQNPLNFVNNFSEVSTELVDEMNEEMTEGNLDDAKEIAIDLKQNLEKINHHGKRAGDIVKNMLQHSRSSSGQKEPTGINALADEYLRLSYHGLRAKDKSFNADFKTDFDPSIGKINIIPQDVGRVLLNLFNNAFYSVDDKKKSEIDGFEPTVLVSTKKLNKHVFISVKDNGNGIPQNIINKIFQPFFTTKPTGEGTGLGLSLAYDIIKAHRGELKVETKEGAGSEFVIQLPVD